MLLETLNTDKTHQRECTRFTFSSAANQYKYTILSQRSRQIWFLLQYSPRLLIQCTTCVHDECCTYTVLCCAVYSQNRLVHSTLILYILFHCQPLRVPHLQTRSYIYPFRSLLCLLLSICNETFINNRISVPAHRNWFTLEKVDGWIVLFFRHKKWSCILYVRWCFFDINVEVEGQPKSWYTEIIWKKKQLKKA